MDTEFNIPLGDNCFTDKSSMPAHVYFKSVMKKLNFESERLGYLVETPVDMVEFIFPGGRNVFCREATDLDKKMYSKQWEQYQTKQQQIGDGYPIEQWSVLTPNQIDYLKAMHIFTVQQLANTSDNDLGKIGMGGLGLRTKARAYVEFEKAEAKNVEVKKENERLSNELETLKAQVKALMESKAESAAPKKRGRPKLNKEGSENDNT